MRRRLIFTVALALLVPVTGAALAAGGYSLSWWTADSGGGTSSGGGYTLSGTIGQADAGMLSGGGYTLAGGFWPGGAGPNALRPLVYLPLVRR